MKQNAFNYPTEYCKTSYFNRHEKNKLHPPMLNPVLLFVFQYAIIESEREKKRERDIKEIYSETESESEIDRQTHRYRENKHIYIDI